MYATAVNVSAPGEYYAEIWDAEPSDVYNNAEYKMTKWTKAYQPDGNSNRYDADGTQTYEGTLSWKSDDSGWWVEDSTGWYPTAQYLWIDGVSYYFDSNGYMK